MSADWWAKKLGTAPAAPNYPPTGGPMGPPPPYQAPSMPPAYPQDGSPPPILVMGADGEKRLNVGAWSGAAGTKVETDRCPSCGSSNFFSRRQNSVVTQNGMAAPAPQCFDCSYNGVFTIYGGS